MRKTLTIPALAALLACGGCLAMQEFQPEAGEARRERTASTPDGPANLFAPLEAPPAAPEPVAHLAAVQPRKVVYTGRFQIATADPRGAVARTKALAERMGGYMQEMTRESIVVRVPAGRFDEAVAELEKLGAVFAKTVQARDVTETYVDLEVRLANAEALLKKLLALLEKAKTVKDALEVEKEIARVRTRVEQLTGKLNRLKGRVAYATLAATFRTAGDAPEALRPSLPFWWLHTLGLDGLMRF